MEKRTLLVSPNESSEPLTHEPKPLSPLRGDGIAARVMPAVFFDPVDSPAWVAAEEFLDDKVELDIWIRVRFTR
jgi:hypothetical protein